MILKQNTIPLRITQDETLLRRLPNFHPKRTAIEDDLSRRTAGYRGEQALAYQLQRLPDDRFTILQDIRLQNGPLFFQMDTLVISPHFLLIIEVKNISGTLFFDTTFNQLVRKINQTEEGFRNPLTQVKYQEGQLKLWLLTMKFPKIPVEHIIAIGNPSTVLTTNARDTTIYQKVLHVENVVDKILEIERKYRNNGRIDFNPKSISKKIIRKHTPLSIDILAAYKIPQTDILTGVQCPTCLSLPMIRKHGEWYCTTCKLKFKNAHEIAIQDHFQIISPTITNKQCREFLHLDSTKVANKILTNMDLITMGRTKDRVYSSAT
ncbi:nuclease-related domain-containing protein [Aquibacillus saliphilus]|uniref:nuclease-related domain-containing protein n=1 Tax=Aquibacillus saliphilus TaxID=1909422 RepID=UPI001CEFF811|nr:nuclease-related domain-containing protein [Aquibacillus saliphilus]